MARKTYKYRFKVGHKKVHCGITNNLQRRAREHRRTWPKRHIIQVGRRTTKKGALRWERVHGY